MGSATYGVRRPFTVLGALTGTSSISSGASSASGEIGLGLVLSNEKDEKEVRVVLRVRVEVTQESLLLSASTSSGA